MRLPNPSLPTSAATVADLQALDAASTRLTTPCNGGELVWRRWGTPGTSAPVLLLHGGSGSWMHWVRNIAPLVQAGRCVVAPDMPGFGESAALGRGDDADAVPPWLAMGLEALQQQLHATLPTDGQTDRGCDVVGFSFGGLIAALLAQHHPQWVRRLVLVGPPALYLGSTRNLDLRAWAHLPQGCAERAAAQAYNLRSLMLAHDASVDDLALWINTTNLERDHMRHRRLARSDLVGRALPLLQMPVWAVWGAQDPLVRDELERLQPVLSLAPRFRSLTLLPGAGHWVQYEDAPAFNHTLAAMLGQPDLGQPVTQRSL